MTSAVLTTVPARIARRKPPKLVMAKATNTPPWGAREPTCIAMVIAPVIAPPAMVAGMTRSGSAAAKGMAPSEMKDSPSSQALRPFSTSALVNSRERRKVAADIASGGTMPAAMTVAMIS